MRRRRVGTGPNRRLKGDKLIGESGSGDTGEPARVLLEMDEISCHGRQRRKMHTPCMNRRMLVYGLWGRTDEHGQNTSPKGAFGHRPKVIVIQTHLHHSGLSNLKEVEAKRELSGSA